jgi:urease accessory protein
VRDLSSLEAFLDRRLRTAGLVAAGVAACATGLAGRADAEQAVARLDAETDARMPSPAQRLASRAQGRGLLRTARACWPAPSSALAWSALGARPHHPVVLGCAGRAAELSPAETALAAAYLAVSAPATAAQRLLAMDPVSVAAVTVRLGPAIELVAAQALTGLSAVPPDGDLQDGTPTTFGTEFDSLPDDSDPLLDLLAERHAAREERLFAS